MAITISEQADLFSPVQVAENVTRWENNLPVPVLAEPLRVSGFDAPPTGTKPLEDGEARESTDTARLLSTADSRGGQSFLNGPRDGATFDPELDTDRLNAQCQRVYDVMKDVRWHTFAEISAVTGDPEASISARLRDLRKTRFGHFIVNKQRRGGKGGLYEYQMVRSDWRTG